jgi:NAD(P)-dependent dehydrogenase (short-subunit alcohol dehydrogenase family)
MVVERYFDVVLVEIIDVVVWEGYGVGKGDPFRDKIAVVTGAASGIGRAVATRLGGRGAVVCAADIDEPGAKETAALIAGAGGRASATPLDVADGGAVTRLVDETARRHGRLDYMFNNAGIAVFGPAQDITDDLWKRVIDINFMGVLSGTLSAYRIMVAQGFGHIVNTASLAGLVPVPLLTAYAATKHAVVGLSTSLRGEGAGLGVKVSVVCPGFVRTPMFDNYTAVNIDREVLDAEVPKRVTDVNEAARAIIAGVAKNRAIILVGTDAHLFWRLYKLWPGLVEYLGRRGTADVRAIRTKR